MARLDDRLHEDLERAARPADPSGLYEDLIRRRERRRVRRVVATSLLAILVVGGSIGAVVSLAEVFGEGGRATTSPPAIGESPPFATNGLVLFERTTDGHGQHLWLAKADGSDPHQMTFGEVIDTWAAWSPDGETVAFNRGDLNRSEGASGLAFLDVATGEVTISPVPAFGAARPDWSPDGTRLAFAGTRGETPRSGIYTMNADGTELRQVTDERFFAPDNPEWSPDGSTIAFTGNLDESPSSWDVYIIAPDGSGLRNVTDTPDGELSEGIIGWLPQGTLLISQGPGEVTTGPGQPLQPERWIEMTLDGQIVRTVYEGYANQDARQAASLSPDGRSVIFFTSSDRDGTWVRSMDLETGAVTRIVEGASPAWQPTSPDDLPRETGVTGATPTTGATGSTGNIPTVLEVTCLPGGAARVGSPIVATQADGLHILVEDQAGTEAVLITQADRPAFDWSSGSNGLDDEFVALIPPGDSSVACASGTADALSEPDQGTPGRFTVVDPEGLWTSTDLACGPIQDDWAIRSSDVAVDAETLTAIEAVRTSLDGLLVSDVVEPAGYLGSRFDEGTVRIVRDGAVVAWLRAGSSSTWDITGYACPGSGWEAGRVLPLHLPGT